jgi:hypothetical protein
MPLTLLQLLMEEFPPRMRLPTQMEDGPEMRPFKHRVI